MSLVVDVFRARSDNYGYLAHDTVSGRTAAIDAPEFEAIKAALANRGWTLTDVLITHHHKDHVEAIPALKQTYGAQVTGPRAEADKIEGLDVLVGPGDVVTLGDTRFNVLGAPGHTLGHIVYHDPADGHLFTADALFAMGVGRMFEGTPAPMWEGLVALRQLPGRTLVYCGHEYTLANARFALSVDHNNALLRARAADMQRLVDEGKFTIPVSLGDEKATNPFLRADAYEIGKTIGLEGHDAVEVFAALRKMKDEFQG